MMRINHLKERLRTNTCTIGSWLQLGHPGVTEIMAMAGFEWLTIDMEHSVISLELAQDLIRIIEAHGVVPLVRVGENNPNLIKRVMDAGAYGVIVPMINSEDDAKAAVSAVKYPPEGTRGVGISRAHGYGRDFDSYVAKINDESVVIAQIEHIDAVNNLESILSVEGLDGCIIGPYDLSGSLGVPGELDHPEVKKALATVERICKEMHFPLGYHVVPPDYHLVPGYIERGYTLLAFSADMLFLEHTCSTQLKLLREDMP